MTSLMYRDIYLEFIITKSRMSPNHTTLSIANINIKYANIIIRLKQIDYQ